MVKLKKRDKHRPQSTKYDAQATGTLDTARSTISTTIPTASTHTQYSTTNNFVDREPFQGHVFTATVLPSTPEDVAIDHIHPWQPLNRGPYDLSPKKVIMEQWPQSRVNRMGTRGDTPRKHVSFLPNLIAGQSEQLSASLGRHRGLSHREPRPRGANRTKEQSKPKQHLSNGLPSSAIPGQTSEFQKKNQTFAGRASHARTPPVKSSQPVRTHNDSPGRLSRHELLHGSSQPESTQISKLDGTLWFVSNTKLNGTQVETSLYRFYHTSGELLPTIDQYPNSSLQGDFSKALSMSQKVPLASAWSYCGVQQSEGPSELIIDPAAGNDSEQSIHTLKQLETPDTRNRTSSQIPRSHDLALTPYIGDVCPIPEPIESGFAMTGPTTPANNNDDRSAVERPVTSQSPQRLGRFPSLRGVYISDHDAERGSPDLGPLYEARRVLRSPGPTAIQRSENADAHSPATTSESHLSGSDAGSTCSTLRGDDGQTPSPQHSTDTPINNAAGPALPTFLPQYQPEQDSTEQLHDPQLEQAHTIKRQATLNRRPNRYRQKLRNTTSHLTARFSFLRHHGNQASTTHLSRSSSIRSLRIPRLLPEHMIGANGAVSLPMTTIAARHLSNPRPTSTVALVDSTTGKPLAPVAVFEQRSDRIRPVTTDFSLSERQGRTRERQFRHRSEPVALMSMDDVLRSSMANKRGGSSSVQRSS